VGFPPTPEDWKLMSGRIESSVCCSALLDGKVTAVDPDPHVPPLPEDVTAFCGVDGTQNETVVVAAWATEPPETAPAARITGKTRRLSTWIMSIDTGPAPFL
jgi:hypothetical protein